VIEPELVFRGFKTILDRPPMALDRDQRFDRCSRWTPGGKEGHIAIDDATTDQQTTCPQTIICAAVFLGLKIGEFDIAPIMQSRPLGSSSRRQTLPIGRMLRPGDVFGLAAFWENVAINPRREIAKNRMLGSAWRFLDRAPSFYPTKPPSEVRRGRGFSLLPVYRLAPFSGCAPATRRPFWSKGEAPSESAPCPGRGFSISAIACKKKNPPE
jgi:hypothetical protein